MRTPKTIYKNPAQLIGCCGAYCKTCKAFIDKMCKGCKVGYDNGERVINKAKCAIKVCCIKKKALETCADCQDYPKCKNLRGLYGKNGFKYKKYQQATEYIRKNGYVKFIKSSGKWKGAYGKLD